MTQHLKSFRKQFKIDAKADLRPVQVAVEAIYEAQKIGAHYLLELDPPTAQDGFRIHAFLNLMSRNYEHNQALLVAIATGSPASSEALGRIVVEGAINLMYLALHGDASTLVDFLQSWVDEHDKKLADWAKQLIGTPEEVIVIGMLNERRSLIGGYTGYLEMVKEQCGISKAEGKQRWQSNIKQRFDALGRVTDYFESYHRLSGATHSTGEDTLNFLMALLTGKNDLMHKSAVEAWAYSTLMSRVASRFHVEAIGACVIAYGRENNDDIESLGNSLSKAIHEIAVEAGVPQPKE